MSDNPLVLLQNGVQAPSALQALMNNTTSDEMQANVGASYAVVTFKGKTFAIKHGGQTTPLTANFNGQLIAAPFFDVVIPRAKAELSKTYYPSNYTEGSDESPSCWSEDGIHPLAPEDQRPRDANGRPCQDCRLCPMNQFGSKISDNGSKSKACADTRKLIVIPVVAGGPRDGNGNDLGVMDADNIRYGGPMLLRVPAASLRVFADYSAKLQGMGLPYYGVVTRLEFDQTVAYPKFSLKALRVLREDEAVRLAEVRESATVRQILESGQTGAAPQQITHDASVAAVAGQQLPSSLALPEPAQPVNNVVPITQPAPTMAQPAPPPAPPAPPAPPPPVEHTMTAKANGLTYEQYIKAGWTHEGLVNEGLVVSTPAAPPAPPAPPPPPAAVVPPTGPAPAAPSAQVTPALMNTIDSLLAS